MFGYGEPSETWLATILCALLGVTACDGGSSSEPQEHPEKCGHLEEVSIGPFFLQNNKWGRPASPDYVQCVRRSAPAPFPVSWRWSSSGPPSDSVSGYPFLGFGQDPWRASSAAPGFPRVLSDIQALTVSHTVRSQATGKYNLAFDIWITREPDVTSPPGSNVTRELMIWLEWSENPLPASWLVGDVTIGGELYAFYRGPAEPTADYVRDYLAFLKKTPSISGTTPIHEFVEYLLREGHVVPQEYLRNVFLGNEIWHGTGETIIEDFGFRLTE